MERVSSLPQSNDVDLWQDLPLCPAAVQDGYSHSSCNGPACAVVASSVACASTAGIKSSSSAHGELACAPRTVCKVMVMHIKAKVFLSRLLNEAFHEDTRGSIWQCQM